MRIHEPCRTVSLSMKVFLDATRSGESSLRGVHLVLRSCLLASLTLLLGCFPKAAGPRLQHFASTAPAVGQPAPPLSVQDLEGRSVGWEDLLDGRPILLQLGSHSCPVYRYRRFSMEDLWRDYRDRVRFLLVYTQEAHPVGSVSPYADGEWDTWWNRLTGVRVHQPDDFATRQSLAQSSRAKLQLEPEFLIDLMANETWQAYGAASSPAFVIDREGTVVARQPWVNPKALREVLDRLLLETP